jgi:hypothetical protein
MNESPHQTSIKLLSFFAWQYRNIKELQANTAAQGKPNETALTPGGRFGVKN